MNLKRFIGDIAEARDAWDDQLFRENAFVPIECYLARRNEGYEVDAIHKLNRGS
jgi:hypothetical protein